MLAKLFSLICIVSIFAGCQRENFIEEDKKVIIDPSQGLVDGMISGQVVDEDGLAIPDVVVQFRDFETTTDADGMFITDDSGVYEHASSVSFSKDQYFDNFKTFNAIMGETTYVDVVLLEKNTGENFNPFQARRYTVDEAYIDLPSGTYLDKSGQELSSDAIFQGRWIDPSVANTAKMPGNMSGVNEAGDLVNISNYGVFLIELSDQSGSKFDLPTTTEAEISFPIPDDLSGIAPNQIPMWYYNTEQRAWVEEGQATLTNGAYIGKASRLEYWTCGTGHYNIELKGNIETDKEIADLKAVIHMSDIGFKSVLNIGDNGIFSILIPAGQSFIIEVTSVSCNQVIETFAEGPYNNDSETTFEITHPAGSKTISGVVTSCDGNPVSEGFVVYTHNDEKHILELDTDGSYFIEIETCDNFLFALLAVNTADGEISNLISMNLSDFDSEDLSTCSDFIVTEEMDYLDLNWESDLKAKSVHDWEVSKIFGEVNRVIISPIITNQENGEVIMTGNFVLNEGATEARYDLNYLIHGFKVSGTCTLEHHVHEGVLNSYRFTEMTQEYDILDNTLFPAGGPGEISFDLTYYE